MVRFAFLIAFLMAASLGAQSQRALSFDSEGWDFGERLQGELDKKTLTITNVSNRKVTATISKTCGCIVVDQKKIEIEAGAKAELFLELDTRRGEGVIKKYVLLETDDPAQRLYSLPMRGKINPVWDISLRSLNLGTVQRGPEAVSKFRITIRAGHSVVINDILSSTRMLVARKTPFALEDGTHGFDVALYLNEKVEAGDFEDVVLVLTDNKDISQRGFRVMGKIKTKTTITPKNLAFGLLKPDTPKVLYVDIKATEGQDLSVERVECDDPMIATEVVTVKAGQHFRIKVTATAKPGKKDFRGTIRLHLKEPAPLGSSIYYYGKILLP